MKALFLLILCIPLYISAQGVPRDRTFMKQDRCKKKIVHLLEEGNMRKALRLFEKTQRDTALVRSASVLLPEARNKGCSRSQLIIPGEKMTTYRYNYYTNDGQFCRIDICFPATSVEKAGRKACAIRVTKQEELEKLHKRPSVQGKN